MSDVPTTYQERVAVEKADLDAKIAKLEDFMGSPAFGNVTHGGRRLLREQKSAMQRYSAILAERIEAFANTEG